MVNFIYTELPNLEQVTLPSGKRVYVTPEGDAFPSVTTMLGSFDKPQLTAWRERVGEVEAKKVSRIATVRGKAVHKLAEGFFKETLPDVMMPTTQQLWRQLKPVLSNIDNIRCMERPLYSKVLGLAGTPDLIADWKLIPSCIDYKTSTKIKSVDWITDYFIQTTAYTIMFEELTGKLIEQIVIIIAVEESNDAQVFVRNRSDYISLLMDKLSTYKENLLAA